MATLYVRGFPDGLYDRVRELAREGARSVSAEVVALMGVALAHEDLRRRRADALERIARRRGRLGPSDTGADTLDLLREDRQR